VKNPLFCLSLAALLSAATAASAHVSLQQPMAQSGSRYDAVFKVGHGCDGAATTALTVRLPPGLAAAQPAAKPGWNVSRQGDAVTWTAQDPRAALAHGQHGEFTLSATLPRETGPLWFRVVQNCGAAVLDWFEVPAQGTSTAGLKAPAVLLRVASAQELAQAQALPRVEGAWARSSVPGQQGTAAFMKLTAPRAMQIVGVASPVAGTAEVHEMKLEGDVMRMRPLARLDLPAGRTVELKPSGNHLMLQDLKQALPAGSTVPLTLLLRDAQGTESKLELLLPVASRAPGSVPGGATGGHKH
jgi:copper(I)-binding protein